MFRHYVHYHLLFVSYRTLVSNKLIVSFTPYTILTFNQGEAVDNTATSADGQPSTSTQLTGQTGSSDGGPLWPPSQASTNGKASKRRFQRNHRFKGTERTKR